MAWRGYGRGDPFADFGGYSESDEEQDYDDWGHTNRQKFQQRTVKVQRWACSRCSKDYASKANLERHVAAEHAAKPRALQAQAGGGHVVPWTQQGSKFPCRYCGNEYASQGNLNRHVTSAHVKSGTVAVASTSQKNTLNVTYNIYNQNFYNCKKY